MANSPELKPQAATAITNILNVIIMKRVILILAIILSNASFFSCTDSDLNEENSIDELAIEGEDAEILPPDDDQ